MDKKRLNAFWDNIFHKDQDPAQQDLISVLSQVPLFAGLTRRELKRVARIAHLRMYAQGERLFQMGHPGAAMFVIKSGKVDIVIPQEGSTDLLLASLGAGTFMGELALLDDSPRSASAVAAEDAQAIAFFRSDFNKLIEKEAAIGSKVLKELAQIIGQRLKVTNQQLSDLRQTVGHYES
ncbi:cyclic nucleotide-binding domain-containing protein [Oceanospirillum sanctuarii]|uniref:cyclic nucleotide-binding domain-containing protein n=1 Tax=Oceanospirillum sanctuarii TaxID=1434821 RepID=UPI00159341F8|nr:cyclic nucleotide-binding domain-containing protein [Oceanospirillum sanctuarii]